jgi:hypothetical protein
LTLFPQTAAAIAAQNPSRAVAIAERGAAAAVPPLRCLSTTPSLTRISAVWYRSSPALPFPLSPSVSRKIARWSRLRPPAPPFAAARLRRPPPCRADSLSKFAVALSLSPTKPEPKTRPESRFRDAPATPPPRWLAAGAQRRCQPPLCL